MCRNVVLEWFKNRRALGDTGAYTIREVYSALNITSDRRRIESIWFNIVKLRESGYLEIVKSIPVRYKLVDLKECDKA